MKIAFLSIDDPMNRKSFSGVLYYFFKGLNTIAETHWIPVKADYKVLKLYRFLMCKYAQYFLKRRIDPNLTIFTAKCLAHGISKTELDGYDVIVAPVSLNIMKYLLTDKPIIYMVDATWHAISNYYESYSNLLDWNYDQAELLEIGALSKASMIVYSNEWARKSAMEHYSVNPDKIKVIEFGANLDEVSVSVEEKWEDDALNILFIGKDWLRKGGEICVDTVKKMNEAGVKSYLHVIGGPKERWGMQFEYVKYWGVLDKNIKEEYNQYIDLVSKCNILMLPSKAECSSIALAEACAYGMAIYTYDTGGLANYVINEYNGYRLPLSAKAEDFALLIMKDYKAHILKEYSKNARDLYLNVLNWDTWSAKMKDVLKQVMEKNSK